MKDTRFEEMVQVAADAIHHGPSSQARACWCNPAEKPPQTRSSGIHSPGDILMFKSSIPRNIYKGTKDIDDGSP
jgi:hypothetical protein